MMDTVATIASFFRLWHRGKVFAALEEGVNSRSVENSPEAAVRGIYTFTLHALVGMLVFATLLVLACALLFISNEVAAHVGTSEILILLKGVAYCILAVDVVLLVVYLVRSTIEFLRIVWKRG